MIEELKAYRDQNDLTQVEMANKLDITEQWYNLIEQGKRKPGKSLKKVIELTIKEE